MPLGKKIFEDRLIKRGGGKNTKLAFFLNQKVKKKSMMQLKTEKVSYFELENNLLLRCYSLVYNHGRLLEFTRLTEKEVKQFDH